MTTLTNDIKIAIQLEDYERVEELLDYSADNDIGFRSDEVLSFILKGSIDNALVLFLQYGLADPTDVLDDRTVLDYIIQNDLINSMRALLRWGDVYLSKDHRKMMSPEIKHLVDEFSKLDVITALDTYEQSDLNLANNVMGYVDNRHVIVNHISSGGAYDSEVNARAVITMLLNEADLSNVGHDVIDKNVWEEEDNAYFFSLDIIFHVDDMNEYRKLHQLLIHKYAVDIRFEHV